MRFASITGTIVSSLTFGLYTSAANSFAGSNLYYAAGLTASERATLLDGMKSAGMKVLRVWLDAESDATTKNTPITAYPALEPNEIGVFNDTVLELLDAFMLDSHARGIKLLISMHSFNALSGGDVYGTAYGIDTFYTSPNATAQFDNRLRHVLDHVHTKLHQPWKSLSQYIFAFEAENEAMIGDGQDYIEAHQNWQCDRANTIKSVLGQHSRILVTTGGESWLSESVQPNWFSCESLDVIAIHAYGVGDLSTSAIEPYVTQAKQAGKKLLFEEWGACYYNTENNDCPNGDPLPAATRNSNIKAFAGNITAAGIPWLYWQLLPNADPHFGSDYEIGVGASVDPSWNTIKTAALAAARAPAAFDFSDYLL